MNLIPPQYRLAAKGIAAAILATVLALAVLFAYEWAWHRGANSVQAKWDTAKLQAQTAADAISRKHAAEIAAIDRAHTAALKEKTDEVADLRARLAAGTVRLRVAAHCPAVPAAEPGAGVDHGEAGRPAAAAGPAGDAYLDPSAEPAYLALRWGIVRQAEQLRACQEVLESERAP